MPGPYKHTTTPAKMQTKPPPAGLASRGRRPGLIFGGAAASLDCVQRLIEIGDDVIDVLGADGQTDRVAADAYIGKLRIGELAVGRGGRVDHKALDIGDIGQQREDLQMIDERKGLLLAALDVEGKDGRAAVGEVLLIQGVVGVVGQAGVVDLLHLGVVGQELNDLFGVLIVAVQTQGERSSPQLMSSVFRSHSVVIR